MCEPLSRKTRSFSSLLHKRFGFIKSEKKNNIYTSTPKGLTVNFYSFFRTLFLYNKYGIFNKQLCVCLHN